MRGAPCGLRMLPDLHSWSPEAKDLREGCALAILAGTLQGRREQVYGNPSVGSPGVPHSDNFGVSGAEEELVSRATHEMWKAQPAFRIARRRAS